MITSLKAKAYFVTTFQSTNEKPAEAFYRLNYCIALAGEGHTIAERLIKPVHYWVNVC